MWCRNAFAVLASASLVAGCGQSPSSPSLASGTSTAPVEAAVRAALNGDPYLNMTIQSFYPLGVGTGGETVLTIQTTGGVRLTSDGVQGRAQFNCSNTATTTAANTPSAQVTMTSSGSVTFEQPLGTTPVVRPCGPGITG